MSKLTKPEIKAHNKACDLVHSDKLLTWEDRKFIIENWHEGAENMNSAAGAFFTPYDMAFHVGIFTPSDASVIDLCCGIGALSFGVESHNGPGKNDITMIEFNPEYAAVAKRVMPNAEVIVGSVYEMSAGMFDVAISNPPFGTIGKRGNECGPRYKGGMQHEIIDIASDIARYGIFILGSGDTPFQYSGQSNYQRNEPDKVKKFREQTGIDLQCMSVDTSCLGGFKSTNVKVEMADCDFENEVWPTRKPTQEGLF